MTADARRRAHARYCEPTRPCVRTRDDGNNDSSQGARVQTPADNDGGRRVHAHNNDGKRAYARARTTKKQTMTADAAHVRTHDDDEDDDGRRARECVHTRENTHA